MARLYCIMRRGDTNDLPEEGSSILTMNTTTTTTTATTTTYRYKGLNIQLLQIL